MTIRTRTSMLALTLAFSAAGLAATVANTQSQRAQTWQLGQAFTIDDGDAGFAHSGFVYSQYGTAGVGADVMYCTSNNYASKYARFTFSNLEVGAEYAAYATWSHAVGTWAPGTRSRDARNSRCWSVACSGA